MDKSVAADLSIEIKVLTANTIEYAGDVDDKNGNTHALPGKRITFECVRPFAFFIKKSIQPVPANGDTSPFDDDGYVYGTKWNQGTQRYEMTSKLKGAPHLKKGDECYYGVAVLNTDGTIQVHDPRILID